MIEAQHKPVAQVGQGALKDVGEYLTLAKFGATALVGFLPSDPRKVLHQVETRGFSVG